MKAISALLLLAAMAQPVSAQEESMELQRCIWRCLSSDGPASNPAYHNCVSRMCMADGGSSAGSQGAAAGVNAREQWVTGRTRDGIGYAGVDGQYAGTGLYYFCGRGQSFLRAVGMNENRRQLVIFVDGSRFQLPFRLSDEGHFEVRLPSTAPVLRALQSGNRLSITVDGTDARMEAPLRGSRAALSRVISGC